MKHWQSLKNLYLNNMKKLANYISKTKWRKLFEKDLHILIDKQN